MSEMVKRVEAALKGFEAAWLLETGSVNPGGAAYREAKARAAIAARRELLTQEASIDAIDAALKAYDEVGYIRRSGNVVRLDGEFDLAVIASAAIDAALKD